MHNIEDHNIQVNGLRLHTRDRAGEAPPLLLLHPNRMNAHIWDTVLPALALPNRILSYDQRGHGYSDQPHDPALYTLDHYIDDAVSVLDHFSVSQAVLVGAATGANIALLIASRYPERCAGLVLVNPPLNITPEQAAGIQSHFRAEYCFDDFETALANLRYSERWRMAQRLAYAEHMYRRLPDGRVCHRCGLEGVAATYGYLVGMSWDEIEIRCPALLLRGPDSPVYSEVDEQQLVRMIPHAQAVTIPDTGQLLPQDNPNAFAQHVIPFVQCLPKIKGER